MSEPVFTPGRIKAALFVVQNFGFGQACNRINDVGAAERLPLSKQEEALLSAACRELIRYVAGEINDQTYPHIAGDQISSHIVIEGQGPGDDDNDEEEATP